MKTSQHFIFKMRDRKGAVAVIAALSLVMLIGFVALAVDVGYVMVTRNELQNVADGAALAGARTLGHLYKLNKGAMYVPSAGDISTIKTAVMDVASLNQAGGKKGIIINDDGKDIVIADWNPTTHKMDITGNPPYAVQVTARRDNSANAPITTFFAKIFGINTVDVSAVATAALSGEGVNTGGLGLPVAINKSWMTTLPCNQNLTFHPSSAGTCAAWHAYLPGKVKDGGDPYEPTGSDMRKLLDDMAALKYSSPKTIAGQTQYDFTNGTLADLFTHDNIQNLFNTMRFKNDGKLDADSSDATWTTQIPIFDDLDVGCSPNGPITIVGFTTIVITGVDPPPASTVYATVVCNKVSPEDRGGGSYYGTFGEIPGLVQ